MARTIIVNGQQVTFSDRAVMGTEILANLGVFGQRGVVDGVEHFTTEELNFMYGEKAKQ